MAVQYNTAYNTSSAYDFSAYEVKHPEKKDNNAKNIKVVKTPKQFVASIITPKTFSFFVMAVTVICLMVYNNAQMNEISREMNILSADLEEMNTEYVRMLSEKESTISPRYFTEVAEYELGLKRLDKYQTEYIYLYHEDKIELAGEAPGFNFYESVKSFFLSGVNSVQEYITGR